MPTFGNEHLQIDNTHVRTKNNSTTMPSAHISRRDYIRWGNSSSSEPTSTLVLTSKTGWYVDVRILRTPSSSTEAGGHDSMLDCDDAKIFDGIQKESLKIDRLDWAFSGQGHATPAHGDLPAKSRWHHWVDSKTLLSEPAIEDEGFMYPQDDGRTLEKGVMVNPETGVESEYEEMWRDIPVWRPKTWNEGSASCVVLVCEMPERGIRGAIMRLGHWCQGVLRVGEEVWVERWRFVNEEERGKWCLVVRVGDGKVGCEAVFHEDDDELQVGGSVAVGGNDWKVTEICKEW